MPSEPKPKSFVASSDFVYAGRQYRKGDPVKDRSVIDRLVRYKSRFIAHKPAKAETPANPDRATAATPTAESPKEN